jgi:hypothetical protein
LPIPDPAKYLHVYAGVKADNTREDDRTHGDGVMSVDDATSIDAEKGGAASIPRPFIMIPPTLHPHKWRERQFRERVKSE